MQKQFIIGIDIGGTNTDAVLVDSQKRIVVAIKTPTTPDIVGGLTSALKKILAHPEASSSCIDGVFLGTTHATNAILQQTGLFRVGLIRIAGHQPDRLPPCYGWPQGLKHSILAGHATINGGYECHGGATTPFCRRETRDAIEKLLEAGIQSLAVVGVFAPIQSHQENEVAILAKEVSSHLPVSLSHKLGGIGFVERENTTLLNAALKQVMSEGFSNIQTILNQLGLKCPLRVTQNNGCVISLQQAMESPVLTISAGPTNSFMGASRLVGKQDAIIVDIGGTSTDVGLIKTGFPKRSLNTSNIGGVQLNFPMPDVLSIALGGGSYINDGIVGPQSAGMNSTQEAQCFGGKRLTLTDVALATGQVTIANSLPVSLDQKSAQALMETAYKRIENEVAKMAANKHDLPVILVGGGAGIIPKSLLGKRYVIPEHHNVANAYGAALAEIAGVIDTVVSLTNRTAVLEHLQEQAKNLAVSNGAQEASTRVVDVQIIPYHYMPDHLARVIISATGQQLCM